MQRVKMESWICREEGVSLLTRDTLHSLQLKKLNEMLEKLSKSEYFPALPSALDSLSQLSDLPFTTSQDLAKHPGHFLSCSQAQVSRVISEVTSGTTGGAKRIFYTDKDINRTVGFFSSGISEMLHPGEKCLITFPFSGPFGLGDLIAKAVQSLGATAVKADFRQGFSHVIDVIKKEQPETYIGFSVPLLSVFRLYGPHFPIERALLSGDACPKGVLNSLPMKCFPHYGSRETVLGGAVTCQAHHGMHLRENHILAEIIDEEGKSLPDGNWGELVISTIGMEAMPLLRYRTGDITRILPEPCPCGGVTRRLDRVIRKETAPVSMEKLDDLLFSVPWVVDFSASFNGSLILNITVLLEGLELVLQNSVQALYPEISIELHTRKAQLSDFPAYAGKRHILRKEGRT